MTAKHGWMNRRRRLRPVARAVGVVAAAALVIAASPTVGRLFSFGPSTGSFHATGSMTIPRSTHDATLLANGPVLITGGLTAELRPTATAELYDPATGTFTATGSMAARRSLHTATLLPDGRVLVAGGLDEGAGAFLASAELYDPATGRFAPTGSMAIARAGPTATLLPDGLVLVAGGLAGDTMPSGCLDSAELYDPTTGQFRATGSMTSRRYVHSATLLRTGQVLMTGGACPGRSSSAELYDPTTGVFLPTGAGSASRLGESAVLLDDGRVVLAGGADGSIEIYDPASGSFTSSGHMLSPRGGGGFNANVLQDGAVLFSGGSHNICCAEWEYFPSGELYHLSTGQSLLSGSMTETRANDSATLLADGRVLIAGGESPSGGGVLSSAELFVP
jgi:WD40 repeat protein